MKKKYAEKTTNSKQRILTQKMEEGNIKNDNCSKRMKMENGKKLTES